MIDEAMKECKDDIRDLEELIAWGSNEEDVAEYQEMLEVQNDYLKMLEGIKNA